MSLNPEQVEICHKLFALWEQFPDARPLITELCETLPRPMFVYLDWLVLRWTHIRPSPQALPCRITMPFLFSAELNKAVLGF